MKKLLIALCVFSSAILFSGCMSTKYVSYFQNMDSVDISANKTLSEVHIKPNDELTILVSSVNSLAAEPFNMNISSGSYTSSIGSTASNSLYSYIVDKEGNINFPVVGKLNVLGLTRPEIEQFITSKIKPYFAESETPVVKVRLSSFHVTVIGEVNGSKTISVSNERISIVEALAQCGDLTIYGNRPNILLVREDAQGHKTKARFNLNDANLFNSPYYYLEQNDIVYVEPNKTKARNSDIGSSTSIWISATSIVLSVASLLVNILK